jgi:hypothetical protein
LTSPGSSQWISLWSRRQTRTKSVENLTRIFALRFTLPRSTATRCVLRNLKKGSKLRCPLRHSPRSSYNSLTLQRSSPSCRGNSVYDFCLLNLNLNNKWTKSVQSKDYFYVIFVSKLQQP